MIISEIFYQEIAQLLNDVDQSVKSIKDVREQMRAFIVQLSRGIVENNDFFKVYVARLTDEAEKHGTTRMTTTFFDGYVSRLAGNHWTGHYFRAFQAGGCRKYCPGQLQPDGGLDFHETCHEGRP